MDLFHTLDGVLNEFMLMVHPKVQKQDVCLEISKEKIETLVAWFNDL